MRSWYWSQNEQRVKHLCTDKNHNFNVFKDSNMLRPNFFFFFFLLIVQYLKEEKGKSCPKSAASLPVNASIMSCALASLTADAASRLSVCSTCWAVLDLRMHQDTHLLVLIGWCYQQQRVMMPQGTWPTLMIPRSSPFKWSYLTFLAFTSTDYIPSV